MKKQTLRIFLWGMLGASALVTFSCVDQTTPNPRLVGKLIEEHNFQLNGVPISPADEQKLKFILKQFDRSLYRVDIFKDGQRLETLGHLEPEYLAEVTTKVVAAKAEASNFTGWTDQLGYSLAGPSTRTHPPTIRGTVRTVRPNTTSITPGTDENPASSFGSSTHPTPGPHSELSNDDQELLRRVMPILKKYTLQQVNH